MTALDSSIKSVRLAAKAADKLKATDLVAFDVSNTLGITDIMLVVSASNERQVLAVAEEIEKALYVDGGKLQPKGREGVEEGQWILLDYGDFIIHIMHDEARAFYNLERIWRDCDEIDLELPALGNDDDSEQDSDLAD